MAPSELRPELPKPEVCESIVRTLAQLQLFAAANPKYARPGVDVHIDAVAAYLTWVRDNQFLARRFDPVT